MPLRFRRGTDEERLTITPAEGEPIYVTDTQKLYIGDGTTLGGNELSGGAQEGAPLINADLPLNGFNLLGEDSKVVYDSGTDTITASTLIGDLTGSVFADDSTKLIDGITGSLVNPKIEGTIEFLSANDNLIISVDDDKININNLSTELISLASDLTGTLTESVYIRGNIDQATLSQSPQLLIGTPFGQGIGESTVRIIGDSYLDGFGDLFQTKLSLGGVYDFPETLDPIQPEGKGDVYRWESAFLRDLDVDGDGLFTGNVSVGSLVAGSISTGGLTASSIISDNIISDNLSVSSLEAPLITDSIVANNTLGDFNTGVIAIGNDESPSNLAITTRGPVLEGFGVSADGINAPNINIYSSRGLEDSSSSLTPLQALDQSAGFAGYGWNGAEYQINGAIITFVSENISPNELGGGIGFIVPKPGTNFSEFWELGLFSNGDLVAPGRVVAPEFVGDFSGDIRGIDSTLLIDTTNNVLGNGFLSFTNNRITCIDEELIIDGVDRTVSTPRIRMFTNFGDVNQIVNGVTLGVTSPGISYQTSRGTIDTPTAVQPGDLLAVQLAEPHDGSDYAISGAFIMQADPNGTISTGDVPGKLSMATFLNGNPANLQSLSMDRRGWVTIGRPVTYDAMANLDVDGDVLITGNLTVQGTTTSVSTADTVVSDNIITLNDGEVGAGITNSTAGIEIDRGTADNVTFVYDDSVDKWTLGTETLVTGALEATSVEISGAFTLPTADGTVGQVLTTDGAGNTSWTTVSGGGGAATSLDGDVNGSVFGDDSTLLVDGVRNLIVGDISAQNPIELNNNNIESVNAINSETGVHSILMDEQAPLAKLTIGSSGGVILTGGAGAPIQIGTTNSGNVTLGSGTNTVDFVSGTTVDFANATVTGLPGAYNDTDVTAYLNGNLDTDIIPDTNTTYDLGSTTNRFKDAYIQGTVTLGTGSISDTEISNWNTAYGWGDHSSAGYLTSLPGRTTISATTSSIADGANEDVDVTGFKGYALLTIETDAAAWVRVYTDSQARTDDAGRSEVTDPSPDAGVIAEVITTQAETVRISPGVFGYNNESPVTDTIYVNITNKSGSTQTVTADLTILQLEG